MYANANYHVRTVTRVSSWSRRRCDCGCRQRATHIGLANGVAMTTGCEMYVRRWKREPSDVLYNKSMPRNLAMSVVP